MLRLLEKHPKCERDVNGRHFFERIGIWKDEYILHKCSQCGKCVYEGIIPLIRRLRG